MPAAMLDPAIAVAAAPTPAPMAPPERAPSSVLLRLVQPAVAISNEAAANIVTVFLMPLSIFIEPMSLPPALGGSLAEMRPVYGQAPLGLPILDFISIYSNIMSVQNG